MTDCILKIYTQQGIKGFYKGIMINSVKSIPEIAIKFTVYDYIKNSYYLTT